MQPGRATIYKKDLIKKKEGKPQLGEDKQELI